MRTSQRGIDLVKRCEGCSLSVYADVVGVLTVGYGHTSSNLKLGQTVTQHTADVILQSDLERFEEGVTQLTRGVTLTQNQFDALVCLTFNVGLVNFANSQLRRKLLAGDVGGAAAEFPRWCHAGGKVVDGLVNRRAAEAALFLNPLDTSGVA